MKLVSLENLSKYNELLNQKTVDVQHNFFKSVITNKVFMAVV